MKAYNILLSFLSFFLEPKWDNDVFLIFNNIILNILNEILNQFVEINRQANIFNHRSKKVIIIIKKYIVTWVGIYLEIRILIQNNIEYYDERSEKK